MSPKTLDANVLGRWIGRIERRRDVLDPRQARLMQALVGREATAAAGDPLPPLWHWLYFPTEARPSDLGRDGLPELGGFLPPVTLPRRMWAGGRFAFERPLRLGDAVEKVSTIKDVVVKEGRSGRLCFVTVRHAFNAEGVPCVSEEHDIVYREAFGPDAAASLPPEAPRDADWQRTIEPGPVVLFRYSALTYNGHRIHYDRDYCRDVEGYPGLVVHGPLTATLLVDLARTNEPKKRITSYEFRAVGPLFDTAPFTVAGRREGDTAHLWASDPAGRLAMTARAVLA